MAFFAMPSFLCGTSSWETGTNYHTYSVQLNLDSLNIKLPHSNLVTASEKITGKDSLLVRDIDYIIDYQNGIISLTNPNKLSGLIQISYLTIPNFLKERYSLYKQQEFSDSLVSLNLPKTRFNPFQNDGKLYVTGSKTFSLSFSNQESYNLNQSLYLSLEGELNPNLKILGKLSDSESPLSPEGDSREISSLDQVFLKIYGKKYQVIFGDQDFQFENSTLMNYKTKLEGISFKYDSDFSLQAALAANGGKPQTNIIQGLDGKQGPYYLSAGSTGQNTQVIPGSESVSINGVKHNRGSDYTIDYSEGSILFKTLITSNSRIIVDFQFTDDYYSQSNYLESTGYKNAGGLSLSQRFIRQVDDKNNPLLWSFSEADKDSLRKAGDSESWGQGVFLVEPGSGLYILKTNANNEIYYEYAPHDSTAAYLIYFSYVGYGKGDYDIAGTNNYRYTGKNLGSYLPVKKLTAPVSKTNLGLQLDYRKDNFGMSAEGVLTELDKNTFSDHDDEDNISFAGLFTAFYSPPGIRLSPRINASYQRVNKFSSLFTSLPSSTDYYEQLTAPVYDSLQQDKADIELTFKPISFWEQMIAAKYKAIKGKYTQKQLRSIIRINQYGIIPLLKWDAIVSRLEFADTIQTNSDFQFNDINAGYQFGIINLSSAFTYQQNMYQYSGNIADDIILGTGYLKINPAIQLKDSQKYSFKISYNKENNKEKHRTAWMDIQKAHTWQADNFYNGKTNSLSFNYTHRNLEKTDLLSVETVKNKSQYDIMDLRSTHQLWSNSLSAVTSYSLNQLEFFPRIRELHFVGDGLGLYDSTGVQVLDGDYDYEYITGRKGQLSTEINAGLNLNFHLSPGYLPKSILHKFKLDSNFLASNTSTAVNNLQLYLLLPDYFFGSDSTKYGKKYMQHTFYFDVARNFLTSSIRYEYNDVLDNRYQELSKTLNSEIELELDWKKVGGFRLTNNWLNSLERETRYDSEIKTNKLSATVHKNVSSSFNTQTSLSFAFEKGNRTSQDKPYRINIIKLNPSASWFFMKRYRLNNSFVIQYNDRSGSDLLTSFPDKRNGTLFTMATQLQYRFNSFTSGSFQYSGKAYPQEKFLHELKMEFRAEL